jgi:uncharacterized NAD(P)/FAD-binding protein YdhS
MGISIGIVGCGTVGATMVAALAAHAPWSGGPHQLVLVDRPDDRWRGRAYQRDTPHVLANGPMIGMSLHHDDPEHGVRWAQARGLDVLPDAAGVHRFLPRPVFGDYLEDGVAEALATLRAAGWWIRTVDEPATGLERHGDRVTIRTRGHTVRTDYVVLCPGGRPGGDLYNLAGTRGYVGSPYPLQDSLADIEEDRDVTVLGTGMTATDVVVALAARGHRGRITLASRNGLLPSVRRNAARVSLVHLTRENLARDGGGLGLDGAVALARAEVRHAGGNFAALAQEVRTPPPAAVRLRRQLRHAASSDIAAQVLQRAVVEAGQDLWLALSEEAKDAVTARHHAALWSFASPIPRSTGETLHRLFTEGRLVVRPCLRGVERARSGFTLRHGASGTAHADVLVDAITAVGRENPGPADELVRSAVATGSLAVHPRGGVRIDPGTGQVIDATGTVDERVFALGELTRGSYYFVSAVSVFTRRAAEIAESIALHKSAARLLAPAA